MSYLAFIIDNCKSNSDDSKIILMKTFDHEEEGWLELGNYIFQKLGGMDLIHDLYYNEEHPQVVKLLEDMPQFDQEKYQDFIVFNKFFEKIINNTGFVKVVKEWNDDGGNEDYFYGVKKL